MNAHTNTLLEMSPLIKDTIEKIQSRVKDSTVFGAQKTALARTLGQDLPRSSSRTSQEKGNHRRCSKSGESCGCSSESWS